MTREKAIIDLNALKFILDNDQYTDEIEEAFDMAISALQQPEIARCEDCEFTDGERPLADGRYWCVLHSSFMYFCSDAERREG